MLHGIRHLHHIKSWNYVHHVMTSRNVTYLRHTTQRTSSMPRHMIMSSSNIRHLRHIQNFPKQPQGTKQFLCHCYLTHMALPLFHKNIGGNFDVPYLSFYQPFMLCFYQAGCFLRMLPTRIVNMRLYEQFGIYLPK